MLNMEKVVPMTAEATVTAVTAVMLMKVVMTLAIIEVLKTV